jgi:FMN-dependent NADH-azoreductase
MNEYGLQIPYLETVVGFIGFGDFQKIVTEESRGPVKVKDKNITAAWQLAQKTIADF